MKSKRGQSMVEVVLSIGVVVLVITGVIVLIVRTVGMKNISFDRKKANTLADVILEDLLKTKSEDPFRFWQLNDVGTSSSPAFGGFTYGIDYSPSDDCSSDSKCTYATVTINWGNNKVLTVNRFFSE